MPKLKYQDITFSPDKLARIKVANTIIAEYQAQGFDLTLRQLYYQHVARGIIPNRDTEYKRLGELISDARLGGLIDWYAIVDRTRFLRSVSHWDTPGDVINSAAHGYRLDKWEHQAYRPEVWIEKDALVGVIEGVCNALDVPFFSCRGYTSQSELWAAGRRLQAHIRNGQTPVILHLGDHDPSGKDMTRDITERLEMFMGGAKVDRLALNFDQVQELNPPPNPAKITDSRATAYIAEFGPESWELDALEPSYIATLLQQAVGQVRDDDAWEEAVARETEERALLGEAARKWAELVDVLRPGANGSADDADA